MFLLLEGFEPGNGFTLKRQIRIPPERGQAMPLPNSAGNIFLYKTQQVRKSFSSFPHGVPLKAILFTCTIHPHFCTCTVLTFFSIQVPWAVKFHVYLKHLHAIVYAGSHHRTSVPPSSSIYHYVWYTFKCAWSLDGIYGFMFIFAHYWWMMFFRRPLIYATRLKMLTMAFIPMCLLWVKDLIRLRHFSPKWVFSCLDYYWSRGHKLSSYFDRSGAFVAREYREGI